MAENKTKATKSSVAGYVKAVKDEGVRQDCERLITIMKRVSKSDPIMWGSAIIGFGSYHYKYESGREGDICSIGFSPRKAALTIYMMGGLHSDEKAFQSLGKYKTGKGCLYIKRMSDVNEAALEKILRNAFKKAGRFRSAG